METQLTDEQYNEVLDKCFTDLSYEDATEQQQATFRVLQFYNEMASGGFEGFCSWVLELLEHETPQQYIEKLVQNLLQIDSIEMANIVQQHALAIVDESKRLADNEIAEDEYVDLVDPANAQYYGAEDQFHAEIQQYMVLLYGALQNRSFYENPQLHIVKRGLDGFIFEGINNFRDMGGVQTKDGRTVKSGLLFRSGHLADANEHDLEGLKHLQLQLIFDYRDEQEATQYPSPKFTNIKNIRIPAITEKSAVKVGALDDLQKPGALDRIVENFAQFYTNMAFDNPAYKALLAEFVKGNAPLLHHCTAGKDRTGVGAALMYLLLGVQEETIIEEYLLTNKANAHKLPKWYEDLTRLVGDQPQLQMLVGVSAELLQAVFDAIIKKYGSYEAYFEKEYGITQNEIEKTRNFYLQ